MLFYIIIRNLFTMMLGKPIQNMESLSQKAVIIAKLKKCTRKMKTESSPKCSQSELQKQTFKSKQKDKEQMNKQKQQIKQYILPRINDRSTVSMIFVKNKRKDYSSYKKCDMNKNKILPTSPQSSERKPNNIKKKLQMNIQHILQLKHKYSIADQNPEHSQNYDLKPKRKSTDLKSCRIDRSAISRHIQKILKIQLEKPVVFSLQSQRKQLTSIQRQVQRFSSVQINVKKQNSKHPNRYLTETNDDYEEQNHKQPQETQFHPRTKVIHQRQRKMHKNIKKQRKKSIQFIQKRTQNVHLNEMEDDLCGWMRDSQYLQF